jgi:hypothetical protein
MSDTGKPTLAELEFEVATKRAQIELYDKTVALLRSELAEAKAIGPCGHSLQCWVGVDGMDKCAICLWEEADASLDGLSDAHMAQTRELQRALAEIEELRRKKRAVKRTPKPVKQAPSKKSKFMRWLNG